MVVVVGAGAVEVGIVEDELAEKGEGEEKKEE